MASAFGFCKSVYRAIIPQAIRHRAYAWTPLSLQRWRSQMVSGLEKRASHDDIYDAEYYAKSCEPAMRVSADVMAETIFREFSPKTAIDVGCGTGALLAAVGAHGVAVQGLEYSQAAIDICTKRGLKVHKFDLEGEATFSDQADVVVSTEVAEHLPATVADRYVDLLCRIGKIVVLTAAVPDGPVGTDHVNEQPNEYWIAKFEQRGHRFDAATSHRWREEWKNRGVSSIYYRTVMVYRAPAKSQAQTKEPT